MSVILLNEQQESWVPGVASIRPFMYHVIIKSRSDSSTNGVHHIQLGLCSFMLLARSKGLIGNQCLVKHIVRNVRRRESKR